MEVKSVACASCGAPLHIPPDVDTFACVYCGRLLTIERGQSYLARETVEKVGRKFEDVGDRTQEAIRASTYATQAELKRLQLSQDLSAAQAQLSSLQAEIRSLERQKQDRKTKQQLRELRQQEQATKQRIGNLQAAIAAAPSSSGLQGRSGAAVGAATVFGGAGTASVSGYAPKDWTVSLVLCTLLGWLGVHRFYSGHLVIGLVQLVTLGGFGIWWLIDLLLIISGKYRDSKGYLLERRKPAVGSGCAWALGMFLVISLFGGMVAGADGSDSVVSAFMLLGLVGGAIAFLFKYVRARKAGY
jgi:uncharacterized Zn finger protein (UPF0148 family)